MGNNNYFIESKLTTYFIGKIFSALITFLSIPLFISWFGEVTYGKYVLAYTTFLVFLSGTLGWLNHALIKYYSLYKENFSFKLKIQSIVLRVSVLAAFLLCLLLFISNQVSLSTLPIIFVGYIMGCFYLNELVFTQVEYKSLKFVFSEILRLGTSLLSVFLLSKLTSLSSEMVLFAGILFSYTFGYFFQTKLSLPSRRVLSNTFMDRQILKKFIIYGFPIGIWMALTPSSNTIDRYVLGSYMGAAAIAQYTAVYDIVFKIFTQLATPIATIIQPILMNIYNDGNHREYKKIRNKAAKYLLALFLPTIISLVIFDDYLITNYLGFKEPQVVRNLKIIIIPVAISSLVWQIAILLQRKIEASGKSYIVTAAMVFVVFLSAILSIILLPLYNYSILGYIALFTSILYLIIIIFLSKKNAN